MKMKVFPPAFSYWLPDMDLNHDKQIQSLLCYRYTIGQAGASDRLKVSPASQAARLIHVFRFTFHPTSHAAGIQIDFEARR